MYIKTETINAIRFYLIAHGVKMQTTEIITIIADYYEMLNEVSDYTAVTYFYSVDNQSVQEIKEHFPQYQKYLLSDRVMRLDEYVSIITKEKLQ